METVKVMLMIIAVQETVSKYIKQMVEGCVDTHTESVSFNINLKLLYNFTMHLIFGCNLLVLQNFCHNESLIKNEIEAIYAFWL